VQTLIFLETIDFLIKNFIGQNFVKKNNSKNKIRKWALMSKKEIRMGRVEYQRLKGRLGGLNERF